MLPRAIFLRIPTPLRVHAFLAARTIQARHTQISLFSTLDPIYDMLQTLFTAVEDSHIPLADPTHWSDQIPGGSIPSSTISALTWSLRTTLMTYGGLDYLGNLINRYLLDLPHEFPITALYYDVLDDDTLAAATAELEDFTVITIPHSIKTLKEFLEFTLAELHEPPPSSEMYRDIADFAID